MTWALLGLAMAVVSFGLALLLALWLWKLSSDAWHNRRSGWREWLRG